LKIILASDTRHVEYVDMRGMPFKFNSLSLILSVATFNDGCRGGRWWRNAGDPARGIRKTEIGRPISSYRTARERVNTESHSDETTEGDN
jgi:hypothetical protein